MSRIAANNIRFFIYETYSARKDTLFDYENYYALIYLWSL
jgi:hypothetical protein